MPEDVWDAGPSSLQKMICFLALWTKSKQVPAWLFCVCLKCRSGQKPWSSTFEAVAEVSDCIRLAGWLATWQVWRCLLKSIKKWRHWMALDNYLIISNPFEPVKKLLRKRLSSRYEEVLGPGGKRSREKGAQFIRIGKKWNPCSKFLVLDTAETVKVPARPLGK